MSLAPHPGLPSSSGEGDPTELPTTVQTRGRLDEASVAAVAHLVAASTEADGVSPLSEHVLLHLRYGGDRPARNVLLWRGGELAGYAHLDVTDSIAGPSAELTVAPAHRGHRLGRMLVAELTRQSPDGRLRLWAHGEDSAATQLARGMGYVQMRTLWQMRRSLYAALPRASLPAGVRLRSFRPGEDDQEWVRLNAEAFAGHPEQGDWTLQDLRRRMREPWFDPSGFLLAVRGPGQGRMLGFHWTKVHGGAPGHPHPHTGRGGDTEHGHEAIGEVYVVGVAPQARGVGLGRALTVAGLEHLRGRGLGEAMLYVEADNTAAIRLYTDLGFTHWDTDRMFCRPTLAQPKRPEM